MYIVYRTKYSIDINEHIFESSFKSNDIIYYLIWAHCLMLTIFETLIYLKLIDNN